MDDLGKTYRKQYPERFLLKRNRQRAKKYNAEGDFIRREWVNLLEEFNYCCAYCGAQDKLTVDHIIPLNKGGTNYISNILPACHICNASKRDFDVLTWIEVNRLSVPEKVLAKILYVFSERLTLRKNISRIS
jgi:hypothetical protein